MKNNLFSILLTILLVTMLFQSCELKQKSKNTAPLQIDNKQFIEINFNPKSGFLIDSVFSQIRVIKLETNLESTIGQADKVLIEDGLIFILDRKITGSIFIFKENGDFVAKISGVNNKRKFFGDISDMIINSNEKRIEVLDAMAKKIVCYSYDGRFLKSIILPFSYTSYTYLENGDVVHYIARNPNPEHVTNGYSLATASKKGTVKHLTGPLTENQLNGNFTWDTYFPSLWKYGKTVFYNPIFGDTIYQVESEVLKARYVLNTQGNGVPYEMLKNMSDDQFSKLRLNYTFLNGNFIDFENYAFFNVNGKSYNSYGFYSKKTDRLITGSQIFRKNPFLILFMNPIGRASNDELLTILSANDVNTLRRYIQNHSPSKEDSMIDMKLLSTIKPDGNPCLFAFKFKSF